MGRLRDYSRCGLGSDDYGHDSPARGWVRSRQRVSRDHDCHCHRQVSVRVGPGSGPTRRNVKSQRRGREESHPPAEKSRSSAAGIWRCSRRRHSCQDMRWLAHLARWRKFSPPEYLGMALGPTGPRLRPGRRCRRSDGVRSTHQSS